MVGRSLNRFSTSARNSALSRVSSLSLSAFFTAFGLRMPVNSLASRVPSLSVSSASNFAEAAAFASSRLMVPS